MSDVVDMVKVVKCKVKTEIGESGVMSSFTANFVQSKFPENSKYLTSIDVSIIGVTKLNHLLWNKTDRSAFLPQ